MADGQRARASAKAATNQTKRTDELTSWLVANIKELDKSQSRAMTTLQGAMNTNGQTLVTASSTMRG
jgi:hypothetical protein